MNPFSTDESYPHTTKIVVNRNAHNQTSITPVIPGSPLVFNQRDSCFIIYYRETKCNLFIKTIRYNVFNNINHLYIYIYI